MVDELIKVIEETEYHYNEVQSIPLICNSDMTMNSYKQTTLTSTPVDNEPTI